MRPRTIRGGDRGETLAELLVAIAVLGIAGVAVLGSVMLGIKVSDIHRKTTGAAAGVRNYVEAIEDYVANTAGSTGVSGGYQPCAAARYYSPTRVGYALPSGWTWDESAALAVGGSGGTSGGCVTTPATATNYDAGIQQITVTINSNDGRGSERLTVVLRKPCTYRWSDPSPAANGACS